MDEEKELTVTELLMRIEEEICSNYCKYPEACMSEREDPDEAEELLYDTYCVKCPFVKL